MPNTATTQQRRNSPGNLVTAERKVKPGLDVDDSFLVETISFDFNKQQ